MPSGVYNRGKYNLSSGTTVWTTTTINVLLTTSSYVPDADHNFVSEITNELSGGGYVRKTLGTMSVVENDTDDTSELKAASTTWTTLDATAGTPAYAIVYDDTGGTDASKELLAWIELASPPIPNGGDYPVHWGGTSGTGIIMRFV